jgi:hypothetical protein
MYEPLARQCADLVAGSRPAEEFNAAFSSLVKKIGETDERCAHDAAAVPELAVTFEQSLSESQRNLFAEFRRASGAEANALIIAAYELGGAVARYDGAKEQ